MLYILYSTWDWYLQSENVFFEALKNDIIMPFDDESMFYIKMGGHCYFSYNSALLKPRGVSFIHIN